MPGRFQPGWPPAISLIPYRVSLSWVLWAAEGHGRGVFAAVRCSTEATCTPAKQPHQFAAWTGQLARREGLGSLHLVSCEPAQGSSSTASTCTLTEARTKGKLRSPASVPTPLASLVLLAFHPALPEACILVVLRSRSWERHWTISALRSKDTRSSGRRAHWKFCLSYSVILDRSSI